MKKNTKEHLTCGQPSGCDVSGHHAHNASNTTPAANKDRATVAADADATTVAAVTEPPAVPADAIANFNIKAAKRQRPLKSRTRARQGPGWAGSRLDLTIERGVGVGCGVGWCRREKASGGLGKSGGLIVRGGGVLVSCMDVVV